jgi:hypothetical protein
VRELEGSQPPRPALPASLPPRILSNWELWSPGTLLLQACVRACYAGFLSARAVQMWRSRGLPMLPYLPGIVRV